MDKVTMVSLGCPKNQIDAETMLGLLTERGYQITLQPEQADIIIVNTCAFIDQARQESITKILEMAEFKKSGKCRQLIVTGCLSQLHYQELARELPEVDAFLGTGSIEQISTVISSNKSIHQPPEHYRGCAETRRLFSTFPYGYLKIAEGCNHTCSYCIIPRLRGPLRSKDPGQIIAEAKKMAVEGIKEIVLIAQDTSQYGFDRTGKSELPGLLSALEQVEEIGWIRLLYCYPDHIGDDLIEIMAGARKLRCYLDIPIQHSHPDILYSMGRNPRATGGRPLIEKLRLRLPGIALRTTLIVGYPGETEEHFQHLLDFVRWAEFDQLGAFIYSKEDGTRAAKLPKQISSKTKARRYRLLMQAQQEVVRTRNLRLVGSRFQGLIDTVIDGRAVIRSYREAPEVDSVIFAQANGHQPGDFVNITCTGYQGYDLIGEIE